MQIIQIVRFLQKNSVIFAERGMKLFPLITFRMKDWKNFSKI